MRTRRHRVTVVERTRHHRVDHRRARRRQPLAGDEDGRFGPAAARDQPLAHRGTSVLVGAGDDGAGHGEQDSADGERRRGRDAIDRKVAGEIGQCLFGPGRRRSRRRSDRHRMPPSDSLAPCGRRPFMQPTMARSLPRSSRHDSDRHAGARVRPDARSTRCAVHAPFDSMRRAPQAATDLADASTPCRNPSRPWSPGEPLSRLGSSGAVRASVSMLHIALHPYPRASAIRNHRLGNGSQCVS